MMNNTLKRAAVAAAVSVAMVAGFATAAQATVGTSKVQANGSAGLLALWVGGVYQSNPATSFGWTDNVIGAGSTSNINATIDCPAGSTAVNNFITTRGQENVATTGHALAYSSQSFGTGTSVLTPNLALSGISDGGTLGAAAIKAAGGNYSVGIACTNNGGSAVTAAFYRYITVTAGTGAWTAAATDYVYTKPTISVTQSNANLQHDANNPSAHYAQPHTTDVLNAVVDTNVVPDGYTLTFQWNANGVAITGQTAQTYTTTTNDAGKTFTVDAVYTNGASVHTVTSDATARVEGDAVVSGSIPVSATVLDATNGQLSLSIPSNLLTSGASLSNASLQSNYSTSTGDLGELTVVDGRVVTLDGWDLTASATDFVNQSNNLIKIDKSQLTILPRVTSKPAQGNAVAGSSANAGGTVTLASSAKVTNPAVNGGNTVQQYVGETKVNATLTLVAPQWKPAGTYASTLTVTVISK